MTTILAVAITGVVCLAVGGCLLLSGRFTSRIEAEEGEL